MFLKYLKKTICSLLIVTMTYGTVGCATSTHLKEPIRADGDVNIEVYPDRGNEELKKGIGNFFSMTGMLILIGGIILLSAAAGGSSSK